MEPGKGKTEFNQNNDCIITTKSNDRYIILHEDFIKPLSTKSYCVVYMGSDESQKHKVIIKRIIKPFQAKLNKYNDELHEELKKMEFNPDTQKLSNILYLISYCEDSSFIYTIFDYYNKGSLTNIWQDGDIKNEKIANDLFKQICNGVINLIKANRILSTITTDDILVKTKNSKYSVTIGDINIKYILSNLFNKINLSENAENSTSSKFTEKLVISLGRIYQKLLYGFNPTAYTNVEKDSIDIISKLPLKSSTHAKKIINHCFTSHIEIIYNLIDPPRTVNLTQPQPTQKIRCFFHTPSMLSLKPSNFIIKIPISFNPIKINLIPYTQQVFVAITKFVISKSKSRTLIRSLHKLIKG